MIDNEDICFYFQQEYASIQEFQLYQMFHSESSLLTVDIHGDKAISLPKSPIGGFFTTAKKSSDFEKFFNLTIRALQVLGVKSLEVIQAPAYYPMALSRKWMEDFGFTQKVVEINHYIELKDSLMEKIHPMEKRKLKHPSQLEISIEPPETLREVYDFINACRSQKGIQINIGYEKLKAQFEAFPNRFVTFSARHEGTLASVVITTIPTTGIVYYFLPATHIQFKKESPMVHLIEAIFQHFQSRGFQYLDLGISSIEGEAQESLIRFKENMGGIRTERVTYDKVI